MTIYRKLLSLLTPRQRIGYFLVIMLGLVVAFLEMLNVASILPFLLVLSDPAIIHENVYLNTAYRWTESEDDRSFLIFLGFTLFALIVVSQCLLAGIKQLNVRYMQHVTSSLSTRLLERYLCQPYEWFPRNSTVDLRKTLTTEVVQIVTSSLQPSIQIVAQAMTITLIMAFLLAVDTVAAIAVSIVVGIIYGLLIFSTRSIVSHLGERRVILNRQRFRAANDALIAVKDVKLAGLERHFLRRFAIPMRAVAATNVTQSMVSQLPRHLIQILLFGGMILFILFMLERSEGEIGSIIPVLGIYAAAAIKLFPAVQSLYDSLIRMKAGSAVLDHLRNEFVRTRSMPATPAPAHVQPEALQMTRYLSFDDIWYTFPGTSAPMLRSVSFVIDANTTVGIVGGTGAGKTTTVDIILGLLTPDSGTIMIDDTVLTPALVPRWQRSLGYVPQRIVMFDATIRENIAFGIPRSKIDDAAVEHAARTAGLHDFIMGELPNGYATHVGELGGRLSGGQRQRVGIARAVYHGPSLLVLDEATSALDNLTEQQVMNAIHNLKHEKTVIMIAHRLTTVKQCDKILFMENGRIRSEGPYEKLYEVDPAFRRLVDAQS